MPLFSSMLELDAEERALTDGRIGPETVGIDRASLCGSMNINEGIEVHNFRKSSPFNDIADYFLVLSNFEFGAFVTLHFICKGASYYHDY